MAEIIKRNKALSVSPLKASSTLGASLAFLGIRNAIAMIHGAQGCTAYGKIYLIGHFREPVALQTTAMDQVSTIMGSGENVIEGLKTLCDKFQPDLIGLPTTGLSETQGSDVSGAVTVFRKQHPDCFKTSVVPVETPDYAGSLETGFAKAVTEMINRLVPEAETKGGVATNKQINILVNASLTPADIEEIKEMVEAFGLIPLVLPDLSTSLDGHLNERDYNPLTTGGTCAGDFEILHKACATIVIGSSMKPAATLLHERTGVPDFHFDHLMGLDAVDRFITTLHELSAKPVPQCIERRRQQLQDAMLDTHFNLGMGRAAIAADPDLLKALGDLLAGAGCELVAAISPSNAPILKEIFCDKVKIGDLEELETFATEGRADFIIGNAHCSASAERLELPLLRAGFPQYDRFGAASRCWIGYRGSRQTLFDLANLLLEAELGMLEPYRSIYAQVQDKEEEHYGADNPHADSGRRHH
ncbi:nitrogenase iron-molybdenum cofactor biosynthesis protein NifN [uncultured Cohaesibacter sp.]|uniref:nitrogenase iron-molybdenum cofactor biosynthesis protein NifN n=1 Tax=uncultured Cohaesibacter sp. TaxID=1002546 RepID=UPI00292F645E|nr:nitrogenase iron-molybdenum cofactor biosynthesis protein NifN [uncultured Cohaesibacter sp.]